MTEPSSLPYTIPDLGDGARREAPAAARNVAAIGDVLAEWLPERGTVLEIASGTGEHALAFARRFPAIDWQPSDPDREALESIAAWRGEGPANLRPPLEIDVRERQWPIAGAAAIVAINLVHISPWDAALGLIAGAGRLLAPGAPLILYGPWREAGIAPAPSNLAFDAILRERDPRWGLREVEAFSAAAAPALLFDERRSMPANNLMLRFRRA